MTMKHSVSVVLALALGACGGTANTPATPLERGKGGGDNTACGEGIYPCGPYGYQAGSVIENLSLVGRPDANTNGNFDDDAVAEIELSRYHQDKNIHVLLLTGSAEWCSPCRMEQPELKELFEQKKAAGGHLAILETIVQDKQGNPSDIAVADRWRHDFDLPFDVTADPSVVLQPYYDINAFPMNMVIRTSDMQIMWQGNGLDTATVKQQIEAVLRKPNP